MIIPNKIKKGDTIGVVAPSNPIIGDNIEEIKRAKDIVEADGFKVKFSKNLFSNTNGYTGTAKEKAEDINNMFADKEIKMIWCAKGGNNSNSTFEYLDFETIKNNPKIRAATRFFMTKASPAIVFGRALPGKNVFCFGDIVCGIRDVYCSRMVLPLIFFYVGGGALSEWADSIIILNRALTNRRTEYDESLFLYPRL